MLPALDGDVDNVGDIEAVSVNQTKNVNKGSCLPEHLSELYEKSSTELDGNQRVQLKQLLIEYADVFSSHDFDLGNYR